MWQSILASVWALALGLASGAAPAFAIDPSPPDCLAGGYGATFLEAPHAAEFECHTRYQRPFTSAGAPRIARIIDDVHAENPTPPATLAALRRGVDAAIATFSSLRGVALPHVAILAFDGISPRADARGEIQAVTNGSFGTAECTITYYNRAGMLNDLEISVTVAHEIFHCMQYATLSAAQMNTYDAGGDWWIEGAAEALADLALPGSGEITDRSDTFGAAVRAHTPLNAMTHQSAPFFQWLIAKKGVQGMLSFQAAMASAGSAAAQHAAMRAAMPDAADWLDFVKAYSENALTGADGAPLRDPAPNMPSLDFTATRDVALTPAPFVLNYGDVTYHCGAWRNSLAPAGMAALKAAGVWGDWPESIESFEDDAASSALRFAALNTGAEGARHHLIATLETPCGACAEVETIDACLVGAWVMTGGGPVEWMRANGMGRLMDIEASEMAMQMTARGTFTTQPVTVQGQSTDSDVVVTGDGASTGSTGKFSAQDGVLNICPSAGSVTARATADGRTYANFFETAQEMTLGYTCAGATLTTTIEIGSGLPPMQSVFTRQ